MLFGFCTTFLFQLILIWFEALKTRKFDVSYQSNNKNVLQIFYYYCNL